MKPKYRLTKLEKLQMHRLMWLWLAEKGGYRDRVKRDWWRIYGDVIASQRNQCFLCTMYYPKVEGSGCPTCPLYEAQGNKVCARGWFDFWDEGYSKSKYARRIAHCADHLIAELEAKQ